MYKALASFRKAMCEKGHYIYSTYIERYSLLTSQSKVEARVFKTNKITEKITE